MTFIYSTRAWTLSIEWQDPLGKSVALRHHGFRLRIGSWMMEVWFDYPNKKIEWKP